MQFSANDYRYMQRAIYLAKKGHYTTSPNPRVGCVLVNGDEIVGEGFHKKAGQGHAEVNALAQAGNRAKGATAYVTLEPCSHQGRTPPCAQALINAEISNVIIAMVDPNPLVSGRGIKKLEQAGINVSSGLLEAEAKALNPGFIKLMTTKLPFVRCKLAASLDGKTAMKSGESKWITSAEARYDVQRIRAQSCAIISGADSIIADNAKMSVRYEELSHIVTDYEENELRQPVRVIIDTKNRLTPNLAIFEQQSRIIIIRSAIEKDVTWPHFVEQVEMPMEDSYIELPALLTYLASIGFNDVLIESGATLAGAFIEQDLVDELVLYQAPKLMGTDGLGLVSLPNITALKNAKNLKMNDVRMVGKDLRIIASFTEN